MHRPAVALLTALAALLAGVAALLLVLLLGSQVL